MRRLRIVVPVLQEETVLAEALRALQPLRRRGAELVVVDGGSTDASWLIAQRWADRVILAPRGRANQMNAGARDCLAEALLFLHADTRLPQDADALIHAELDRGRDWGRFDVRIEGRAAMLKLIARMMNLRSRFTGIATGDQAMFVRTSVFRQAGGFPAQPLMEDIELSARLRHQGPPACIATPAATSGRRWEQRDVWRTIALMWRLRAQYRFGVPAQVLAARYGYREEEPVPPFAVAVMAKAPVAGLAKTRLIPVLGAAGAARAQRAFTRDTLQTACAATDSVALWCAPDARHRFFRALAATRRIDCRAQPGGDLGARMLHATQTHFAQHGATPLLIVGTDCPVLAPGHLRAAALALRTHDVVLIPATDGGYVLVGLRVSIPALFHDIEWSTPRVLEQTRAALRAAGHGWLELSPLWDVDEPSDWNKLQREFGDVTAHRHLHFCHLPESERAGAVVKAPASPSR